jgi:hypothetical protein
MTVALMVTYKIRFGLKNVKSIKHNVIIKAGATCFISSKQMPVGHWLTATWLRICAESGDRRQK